MLKNIILLTLIVLAYSATAEIIKTISKHLEECETVLKGYVHKPQCVEKAIVYKYKLSLGKELEAVPKTVLNSQKIYAVVEIKRHFMRWFSGSTGRQIKPA